MHVRMMAGNVNLGQRRVDMPKGRSYAKAGKKAAKKTSGRKPSKKVAKR